MTLGRPAGSASRTWSDRSGASWERVLCNDRAGHAIDVTVLDHLTLGHILVLHSETRSGTALQNRKTDSERTAFLLQWCCGAKADVSCLGSGAVQGYLNRRYVASLPGRRYTLFRRSGVQHILSLGYICRNPTQHRSNMQRAGSL